LSLKDRFTFDVAAPSSPVAHDGSPATAPELREPHLADPGAAANVL